MTDEHQRKSPRVDADFNVVFETIDQFAMAYCTELSAGGMFLATESPAPVGTILSVRLVLPETRAELSIPSRVVHARTPSDASATRRPAGMGVQFVNLDPSFNARLEQFIAERMEGKDEERPNPILRRGISLLVVEDDPQYQKLVMSSFASPGDFVRVANNGFEALAMCAKLIPDVIVSDVNMPKMNGWQFLRLLRSKPQFSSVPVLFTTTLGGESDRLKGYSLGVDDYIAKPFRGIEVRTRVELLLNRLSSRATVPPPDKVPVAPGEHSLRGDLAHVSLPSVLSFIEMERRTGRLTVRSKQVGTVTLRAGAPIAATLGTPASQLGRDALFEMLDWREGDFEFATREVTEDDAIGVPLSHLLLEHARLADEGNH